ncbi:MAG: aminoacyl-tRNA hydrolase [Proteobacteria bacterium]|nr:aminoacyl-tRNA hydrolase [Pseudomonadota bacterium]
MIRVFKRKESGAWLFAGLGNPGGEYEGHRHNIGFMAADAIAAAHGFPAWRSKYQAQMAEGALGGMKVILLKPQTYMNDSGQSVAAAAKFYKIPAERTVVFHDELDLAAGKVKVKQGGGNAGHNGLRSIDAHLGAPDYWRVRLGIGHPGDKDRVHNYVLGDFSKADKRWLEPLLAAVAEHAPLLMGDAAGFMSKVAMDQQQAESM